MTPKPTETAAAKTSGAPRKPRGGRARPAPRGKTFGVTSLSLAAAAIGLGGALLAVWLRPKRGASEHAAPDLALDKPRPGPADRAPEAFRPDPTAVPTAEEREALRPATGHAPGFSADRGSVNSQ